MRISADDPRAEDVSALLLGHLAWANLHSPPEDVHALDVERMVRPELHFVSCRDEDGGLLGVGALLDLGSRHAELKSMHTAEAARGRGVARAVLAHLLAHARGQGFTRVSLETGSMEAFAPARALYAAAGFTACEPFADYRPSSYSVFLTLDLEPTGD